MSDKPLQSTAVDQEVLLDYRNPRLPVEDRVADLLSRMTLEEKVAQMLCIWNQKKALILDEEGRLDVSKLRLSFPHRE